MIYWYAVYLTYGTPAHMSVQTALLNDMKRNMEKTVKMVEEDANERKAEMLSEIRSLVDSGFKRLDAKVNAHIDYHIGTKK